MKHYLFVVEGPHDVAVIEKVLSIFGLSEKTKLDKISSVWKRLIPSSYPFRDNRLDRVSPVPTFYENALFSVAILVAIGESQVIKNLDSTLKNFSIPDLTEIKGIAIFYDADQQTAKDKLDEIYHQLEQEEFETLSKELFVEKTGDVRGFEMDADIYIFPNNNDVGTLEDLLLEGGKIIYPGLLQAARNYVNHIKSDYESKWSISSENKVLVGCMGNVLTPGAANGVIIKKNDWICEATLEKSVSIKTLYGFITSLLLGIKSETYIS